MHADFSVELGHEDPVLEIPWASDDHSVRYYDLKTSPELVSQIPEAVAYPEIRAFLTRINGPGSPFATAKCDAWESREITPEEEIFGAGRKFVSYIDLIFVDEAARRSFETHEEFAKDLCILLGRAPDVAATVELVIRHCYYHQQRADSQEESDQISTDLRNEQSVVITGFSLTAYVTGFADGDHDSRPRWAIAVSLLQHALVQLGHI